MEIAVLFRQIDKFLTEVDKLGTSQYVFKKVQIPHKNEPHDSLIFASEAYIIM